MKVISTDAHFFPFFSHNVLLEKKKGDSPFSPPPPSLPLLQLLTRLQIWQEAGG